MKKTNALFATCLLFFFSVSQSFAWIFAAPNGIVAIPGVTYSVNLCNGVTSGSVRLAVPGDPFCFVLCDYDSQFAAFYDCAPGTAFNPNTQVCDWTEKVVPIYPDFPWSTYPNGKYQ
ncbi:chitin binding peritrophin-A domain-containing protein [Pedobacter sp. MW01-1-1]|uniref:chitin binding peritrophin-A domain-containing protein n=1 Tax=Pedobacter sp. MW01-1-1 TaxID=3383027 RepID=UPI003FEE8E4D